MNNFVLNTEKKVKEKLDLLDSLKDIQVAHKLSDVINEIAHFTLSSIDQS